MARFETNVRESWGDRRERWRRHLAAWAAGNQSQAAFCRKHGLDQCAFSGWKRRLNFQAEAAQRPCGAESNSSVFVPVKVRETPTVVSVGSAAPLCEIVLRNGRVLRVALGADAACLARLAAALEG